MGLFELQPNEIVLTADLKEVPEFKAILDGDNVQSRLAYIYHVNEWSSSYAKYPRAERIRQCNNDFNNGEDPDGPLQSAVDKYKELITTPSLELLEAAKKASKALQDYFDTADPAIDDNPGRAAKDLMANLEKVGTLIGKFKEWEEQIKKDQQESNVRRGVQITKYNQ